METLTLRQLSGILGELNCQISTWTNYECINIVDFRVLVNIVVPVQLGLVFLLKLDLIDDWNQE
jgi:hypothetical protein